MSLTKVHADLIKGDIGAGGSPSKGQVVQVQTYHVAQVSPAVETGSTDWQESRGCKVTITPEFSNSLIICDFVAPMSRAVGTAPLITRLLLNNVEYGSSHTTGYIDQASSFTPSVFKTIHSNLAAGTPVEFNVQFRSDVSGQFVQLAHNGSSMTMTLTEIAQ